MRLALVFLALAQPAFAETWFACDFGENRSVTVSHDNETAVYAFEHPTNNLTLTRPLAEVHLTPWPGIGRTIWEEVTFQNAGYSYTVFASIDRIPPDNDEGEIQTELSGGILVTKDNREIVHLDCLRQTIDFPWGTSLFDAKEALGQCYDPGTHTWDAC